MDYKYEKELQNRNEAREDQARHDDEVQELQERVEELEGELKDIEDDLEYALLKFQREVKNASFRTSHTGWIFLILMDEGFNTIDEIIVTDNGNIYNGSVTGKKITQAEMWKVLEGWK